VSTATETRTGPRFCTSASCTMPPKRPWSRARSATDPVYSPSTRIRSCRPRPSRTTRAAPRSKRWRAGTEIGTVPRPRAAHRARLACDARVSKGTAFGRRAASKSLGVLGQRPRPRRSGGATAPSWPRRTNLAIRRPGPRSRRSPASRSSLASAWRKTGSGRTSSASARQVPRPGRPGPP